MKESVEKWNASMLMIVLEELGVLNQIDPDSILDYQEFLEEKETNQKETN